MIVNQFGGWGGGGGDLWAVRSSYYDECSEWYCFIMCRYLLLTERFIACRTGAV